MKKPTPIDQLHVQLYVDGAKREDLIELATHPYIKGFTTNPNLLRKAGVSDYQGFATDILKEITDKPISFEVFADDLVEMERQARIIHTWGENVYVKIPVTNTSGESTAPLIKKLAAEGMKLNITLIIAPEQVAEVADALDANVPSIVSIFAGRIADTGVDPLPIMREAKSILSSKPAAQLLWASCREVYNIYEAESVGADIITVPPDILKKIGDIGKDLSEFSLEGVKAFYEDGKAAGFSL
ncbi:MAG: transaldolase [Parcubacteria group bacterium]|nr:transaldolase [Parcubacteria group bacterium]